VNFPEIFGAMHDPLTSITISLVPTLINRSVLSLKKAADFGDVDRAWSMEHFSTIKFERAPMPTSSMTFATQPSENLLETRSDTSGHDEIPLDELARHAGP